MISPKEQGLNKPILTPASSQGEQSRSIETLFPPEVLPTRRFVVELPGYQMEVKEPRSLGRGYQRHWVTYPNWVGIANIEGRDVKTEITSYWAITKFTFITDDSDRTPEEWLLEEEGGRGFSLQLYSRGADTEAIVNSFFQGPDFRGVVPYKEQKKVSYRWSFPKPDHIFPIVTVDDVDLTKIDGNSQKALDIMGRFKQFLLQSELDSFFAKYRESQS